MAIGNIMWRAGQAVVVQGIREGAHGKIKGNGLWRAQLLVCTAFFAGREIGARGVQSERGR